jgi:hypothetical protein
MSALLFCLPPLTWTATGLLACWLAARQGKSWRWGFALGFFFSTAGVALAALPCRNSKVRRFPGDESDSGQGDRGIPAGPPVRP